MAACKLIRRDVNNQSVIESVIASNGAESKLFQEIKSILSDTKGQDALVHYMKPQTEEFKQVFTSNLIVDENNEPVIFYPTNPVKGFSFEMTRVPSANKNEAVYLNNPVKANGLYSVNDISQVIGVFGDEKFYVDNLLQAENINPNELKLQNGELGQGVYLNGLEGQKNDVKEGVDDLFNENPELASIGSKEQYSQYLDTIFPESKVKDIVYHGSENKFDKFDISKFGKTDIGDLGLGFYFALDKKDSLYYAKNNEENIIKSIVNIKNPIGRTEVMKLKSQYFTTDELEKAGIPYWALNKFENAFKVGKKEGHDGVLDTPDDTWITRERNKVPYELVVFEPDQIHILGSKQDIEGFKEFVNNKYQQDSTPSQNNLQQGFEWLKSVLPNANTKLVQGLIDGLGRGAYNTVEDLIMASEQFADKGTIKHEAVHRVLALLPEKEREDILNEASLRFGIPRGKSTVNVKYSQAQQNEVNYVMKVVEALQKLSTIQEDSRTRKYGEVNKAERLTIRLNTKERPYLEVNLRKTLQNKGVTNQQIDFVFDYMKSNSIQEISSEQLALELASKYSFTVEVNTANAIAEEELGEQRDYENNTDSYGDFTWRGDRYTRKSKQTDFDSLDDIFDQEDIDFIYYKNNKEISLNEYNKIHSEIKVTNLIPTAYYSDLTVPGGTNYTEQEIATPLITPSIKGHAEFATDNGIGWFRSDDKVDEEFLRTDKEIEDVKTRRILEVQSDLFQKGRDKDLLIGFDFKLKSVGYKFGSKNQYEIISEQDGIVTFKDIETNKYYKKSEEELIDTQNKSLISKSDNQFLQLLNKDNNWVTFFVKSIIQDSSKRGYEKVLFPSGNTASKVEGHTTLEEFKKQKEDRIKQLQSKNTEKIQYSVSEYREGYLYQTKSFDSEAEAKNFLSNNLQYRKEISDNKSLVEKRQASIQVEINQLKKELEDIDQEGLATLKPIYNFYENTVTNILNKQFGKENVKQVTDEYGNTWNEIDLSSPKVKEQTNVIKFQSPKLEYTGDLAIEEKIAEMAETSKDETIAKTPLRRFIQNIKNFFRDLFKERDSVSRLIRNLNQGRYGNLSNANKGNNFNLGNNYEQISTDIYNKLPSTVKAYYTKNILDSNYSLTNKSGLNTFTSEFKKAGYHSLSYGNSTVLFDENQIAKQSVKASNTEVKDNYNKVDTTVRQKYFKNSNITTDKKVLDSIANSNSPLAKLASHLRSYASGVPIKLLEGDRLQTAGKGVYRGIYYVESKSIEIAENAPVNKGQVESLLLHEILHSMTADYLLNNKTSKLYKDFNDLYNVIKQNKKVSDSYAMSDLDEFLVALFTNASFINELKNIPGQKGSYENIFQEFFNIIFKMFNINKNSSIYEEAFTIASNIVKEGGMENRLLYESLELVQPEGLPAIDLTKENNCK